VPSLVDHEIVLGPLRPRWPRQVTAPAAFPTGSRARIASGGGAIQGPRRRKSKPPFGRRTTPPSLPAPPIRAASVRPTTRPPKSSGNTGESGQVDTVDDQRAIQGHTPDLATPAVPSPHHKFEVTPESIKAFVVIYLTDALRPALSLKG